MTQLRRSRTAKEVIAAIGELVDRWPDVSGAEVRRRLLDDAELAPLVPSLRTVEAEVARVRLDPSAPWTSLDPDPDGDAPYVLAALAAVVEQTQGRRTSLTRDEAREVARVMRAAPVRRSANPNVQSFGLAPNELSAVHAWTAYQLARRYLTARDDPFEVARLDIFLGHFALYGRAGGATYETNASPVRGWITNPISLHQLEEERE